MTATMEPPSAEEIARVKAWEEDCARVAQEREDAMNLRRPCSMHGPGPTGRMRYGRAPYGYGPVCKFCRKEWSRRHGGVRWLSDRELREIEQEKRAAVIREAEAMAPAEFYVAWAALVTERRADSARLRFDGFKPDDFGVYWGDDRYRAMRERVRRESRQFEEARNVV